LQERRPSLLPFDPADLVAIRVLPAEFSRMLGTSKQTVSRWVKRGWVQLGPDGRLDPVVATRELLKRDPALIRVRVFRQALASQSELRARIATLENELASSRASVNAEVLAAMRRYEDEMAERIAKFLDVLQRHFPTLASANERGPAVLDRVLDGWCCQYLYSATNRPPLVNEGGRGGTAAQTSGEEPE